MLLNYMCSYKDGVKFMIWPGCTFQGLGLLMASYFLMAFFHMKPYDDSYLCLHNMAFPDCNLQTHSLACKSYVQHTFPTWV